MSYTYSPPTVVPYCEILQPSGVGLNGIPYAYICKVFEKELDALADPKKSSNIFEEICKIESKINKLQSTRSLYTIVNVTNQISSYKSQIRGLTHKKSIIDQRIKYQNLEAKDALCCLELGYLVYDCSKRKTLDIDELKNWLLSRGESI